jgi:hypothetical protein
VLEIAQRKPLQMGKNPIPQIGLAAPRETVDIDAPAVTKKALHSGGAEDQQRILDQRAIAGRGAKRGIDAALDQPRQANAGEVGGNQRQNAQDEKPSMPVN